MFITFEGMDGSGKTTALLKVKEELERLNYKVLITREPGGEVIAEQIRQIILDNKNKDMDAWTEALLFIASRNQHLQKVIKPALEKNIIVISDRFIDSTSAYQGSARNIGVDVVSEVQQIVLKNCLPDLTLFFDVSFNEAEKRMQIRGENSKNRLDKEENNFKQKVYQGYLELVKNNPKRIKVIDANKDVDQVYNQAIKIILEKLKENEKRTSN
ncbi:dTMP kinase [Mycoplasma capricolum subsp. capripneumoniae]|uniref:Thymidylate kinase n=1 Tax=Mycoplasma capricolum subsp. capripneumoniae 87001 TaxID=1124992 RepID=A0A9N7ARY0_MYCCC|nr:dTMP kinase [Mycoplasma capricolum]AJK51018.1 thymidylate kinase [Mycoplasma capricolum subsp. capripneumoniae 87001]AOQ21787.1 dTMP kinase [Mycoplasma capricolum subsp. capripneumoniae M1601]AQU77230.1 dTMP kinase [Mycoplasma capricolum subsp. capripneumoniae]KEY84472.1 Thymidylate kinase [Mycoplasma capricolum subsp. capripneumoniae 99108]QDL19277.1 dTMP kinase [Mycoplasma capricolum subsp. capripneumoniae]